ncbi:adhesion G protein-coupled receptor F5-like isoform X4 [Labeo rohita]|uniref:adhesion G protein-coupled receptor F5-like isoform X4 n=1 Tax=Labeo rohita TaxID=84645 RepID=UPI0021E1E86E|nr:adhesion G protein-coupled receptor F5-like isoform X4 [Labeo rohita]
MASEVSGKILKYLIGIIMAILLTHVCVVEIRNILGFSFTDGSAHHIRRRSAEITECVNSSLVCGPNANCSNYNGSYSCSCWEGYNVTKMNETLDSSNPCIDIDECQFGPSVCGTNAICTNEMGSYNCSCLDGFTATNSGLPMSTNNTCTEITECVNSSLVCGPNANCSNYNGNYSCSCWEGYSKNVANMNETINSSNPCIDIDECQFGPSVCGPNATCTNTMGSYNCSCLDGFTATNSRLPISTNNTCAECAYASSVCGPNARCSKYNGSNPCSCWELHNLTDIVGYIQNYNPCIGCMTRWFDLGPTGYYISANYMKLAELFYNKYSREICLNPITIEAQIIVVQPTSYIYKVRLSCPNEWCLNENKCLFSPSVCGPNAICTNEMGSYSCSCLDGFTATNSGLPISTNNTCTEITECVNSSLVCGPNANCSNYNGNYSCSCWEGYNKNVTNMNENINNSNQCIDIDECQFGPSVCGPNATCTNTMGSYKCLCLDGFIPTVSDLPISTNNTCRELLFTDFLFEFELESSRITVINEMRQYLQNITFPLQFSEVVEVLDVDITTVCNFSDSGYKCICEDQYFWPCDKCKEYGSCDSIINNTCSCINNIPSDRQFCQAVSEITNNTACGQPTSECAYASSVCGPNSNCSKYDGSNPCSCWEVHNLTHIIGPINNYNPCIGCMTRWFDLDPSGYNINVDYMQLGYLFYGKYYAEICLNPITIEAQTIIVQVQPASYIYKVRLTCPMEWCLASSSTPPPILTPPTTANTSVPIEPSPTTAATTVPTVLSSVPSTTRTTAAATTDIGMRMTIVQAFDLGLADPNSETYKKLSGLIQSTIDTSYTNKLTGYITGSTKVSGFRPGSVLTDYTIRATSNSLDFAAANKQLSDSLKANGIILPEDAFAQSDQTVFVTDQLYPLQKVDLNCKQTDFASGPIKWKVGDKDPALDTTKYLLSNDNRTLTVKSTSESDSAQYSCIMQKNAIPYIQWQNIVIKQRPSIIVGEKYRVFPCDGSSFQLKCSVDVGYNLEWVLDGTVQIAGSDSITLNYNTQSGNCTEKTFTCRLKDLPQLQVYSYSYSSITVSVSPEKYDCRNEELGVGKTDEVKTGVCGKGNKGTIAYKCQSNVWKSVEDNCVLEIIVTLSNTLETLTVDGIPVFMANLSIATSENNINITQSAATIRTIVNMLYKVADLAQSAAINNLVMGDFLNTVDNIVSSNVSATWNKLNKDNETEKTSIKLLSAIENISDRLTDEFAINQTSIQLNRATIKNSFNITSALPNSTTEIVIPQVPQETIVTIIIFSTLDNVLPSRGTNDSRKSDVRINGDVVVVKVNETINNISFAFDITNQSLGNPECVFWNFSLNTWDSTGCQVKRNNTGNITCECNHTTSFSILMSPFLVDHIALAYITYIGVTISMASLIICLIIEAIVWKSISRNDTSYMRHVCIVNIAVSLLVANICFIIGAAVAEQEQPTSVGRCTPAVFFMHFLYLALFFWMLISALLLFYRTVMVFSQMSRAKMMVIGFIVGYGAPLLIAVITVASTAGPQNYISKRNACWLNWSESMALLAFVIPALTIVAINLLVLIVVLYKMLRRGVGSATQPDEKHALVVIARCVAFLTPIFGLTWGFGIGTMVSQNLGIHVVFALLNSLQGFFILVFGTLLDSKVRESLPGRGLLQKLTSNQTNSTSAGPSSTSGLNVFQRMRRRNVYNVSEPNNATVTDSSNGSYNVMNT